MAQSQSIPPFPENIDRRHFASWISGFADGEGCFVIAWKSAKARGAEPFFAIMLRSDDSPSLRLIQSFWQCGSIYVGKKVRTSQTKNAKLQTEFRVGKRSDLVNVVIPHFEQFPLIAKKSRDFLIWKEAVLFLDRQPKCANKSRLKPLSYAALQHYQSLVLALREQRQYVEPDRIQTLPLPPEPPPPKSLLDFLPD